MFHLISFRLESLQLWARVLCMMLPVILLKLEDFNEIFAFHLSEIHFSNSLTFSSQKICFYRQTKEIKLLLETVQHLSFSY